MRYSKTQWGIEIGEAGKGIVSASKKKNQVKKNGKLYSDQMPCRCPPK